MAVLKQELTRTTFQDRQIKLMTDLYTEVRNLDKDISSGFNSLKTSLISGVNSSIQGLYYSFVRYWETGTAAFITDLSDLMDDLREGIDEDSDNRENRTSNTEHQLQAERYQQYITNQKDTYSKVKTIVNLVTSISKTFGISLDRFMGIANTMTDLENIAVRNTGLNRQEVLDFKDNIVSMVSNMNKRTDNLYSKVGSFELLVGLINQTGIKNLEFYEEYGELFITTQKTMNVNLGTLAEFADSFYRVYKFSSSSMEGLMESIKLNTAGTSTSEEKLSSFLTSIASDVRYFEYRRGGTSGLESRTTSSLDRIGGVYTWLRELGYDSDDLFNSVLSATKMGPAGSTAYKNLITSSGIRYTQQELLQKLLSDPEGLMIEILTGQGKNTSRLGLNSAALSDTFGYNFTNATQAEMFMGQLTRGNYESFMANRTAGGEKDLFLSAEERKANSVEDIGIQMAALQEKLGISLQTIYDILSKIFTAVVAIKGVSFLGRLFGGAGGSVAGGIAGGTAGGAGKSLLGKIGGFLSSTSAKVLGGIGAFLWAMSPDNPIFSAKPGNDDLIDSSGNLTDLGRERGYTEEDAAAMKAEMKAEEDAEAKLNRLVGNRFGGHITPRDLQWAESYYDFLRTSGEKGASKKYILDSTPADRKKVLRSILTSVEWQYNNNGDTEDLDPYTFYPVTTDSSDFDEHFTKYAPNYEPEWKGKFDSEDPGASYAKGTPFIPNDQLALLHEGEAVIPAAENPFAKYTSTDRHSYLKDIAVTSKNLETGSNSMKTVVEYLSKILMFMQYWKNENDEDDVVKDVLENARNMNIKLQLYTGDSTASSAVVG